MAHQGKQNTPSSLLLLLLLLDPALPSRSGRQKQSNTQLHQVGPEIF
jgi:hypothetical protein